MNIRSMVEGWQKLAVLEVYLFQLWAQKEMKMETDHLEKRNSA